MIRHIMPSLAIVLLLLILSNTMFAQQAAGITVDKATRITAPTTLTVQSGSNYVRFDEDRLPATITYIPAAPFGTIPMALVTGDTIEAERLFADCGMTWRWRIVHGESDKIVEIKAHENALIQVDPYACEPTVSETGLEDCDSIFWNGEWRKESGDYTYHTTNAGGCDSTAILHLTILPHSVGDTTATEDDSFTWYGTTYTQSAEPTHTFTNRYGCDSVVTLHLTIIKHYLYDTVYFCEGFNQEHEELVDETLILRYRLYTYESPTEWDYKAGLLLAQQDHRAQIDLRHVEESLEAHYVNNLEPVKLTQWSFVKNGETEVVQLQSTAEPLWTDSGRLTIEVRFACGHVFSETIEVGSTEALEHAEMHLTTVRKELKNGQIYILRGNTKYSVLGTKIE